MKIWLVTRSDGGGYDEYDSFVVIAGDAAAAKLIHPHSEEYEWAGSGWLYNGVGGPSADSAWADPDSLCVEEIGDAKPGSEPGVVLASYNAG